MATNAVEAATEETSGRRFPTRKFCVPEKPGMGAYDSGSRLVLEFSACVEAHPAVRDANADEIFTLAVAERWPCPH